jgi:uncharacterized membrane protein YoaK (UPF0700 family)
MTTIYQKREFKWLVVISSALALQAGFINAITFSGNFSVGVTHVTGISTRASLGVVWSDWIEAIYTFGICVGFTFGGVVSGVIVGKVQFKTNPAYGYALLVESSMIGIAAWVLVEGEGAGWTRWMYILVAVSMGLQNAMFTAFSSAVVRTTHVTGIATDIGLVVGYSIRNYFLDKPFVDRWKLLIFVPIWTCFFIGGIAGGFVWMALRYKSLLIPAATTGASGLIYLILYYRVGHAYSLKEKQNEMPAESQEPMLQRQSGKRE